MTVWCGTRTSATDGRIRSGTIALVPAETPTFAVKPTLRGERVVLRPVTASDAAGLVELLRDPEVRRLTGTHGQVRPGALERAQQWYAASSAADDRLDLAVLDQATGGYVGEVVLGDLDVDNASCSVRIALAGSRAVGRGLGTEAMRLILGHAFETVGLHRVWLEVHDINPRARHVYEKVGFIHEGVQRQALRWHGAWIDTHLMAMLADEWTAHRGHPQPNG